MKKLLFLFLILSNFAYSQTIYGKWKDYFSYFHVLDVIDRGDYVLCATENGLFTYDKSTQELEKISKATGLHGVKISTIGYNSDYDYLFIAYQNGAFDIITPNGIEYFVDIPIDTDFQGDKAVNHIYSKGDKAIFSMDFGIVVFDIPKLEFDETTYFRNGSDYYRVNESFILDNEVIALSENGIYTHEIGDLIPNFNAWLQYFPGTNFVAGAFFNNQVIAATSGALYATSDGIAYSPVSNGGAIIGVNNNETLLSVIHASSITEYDTNLNIVQNHNFNQSITTGICTSSDTYAGTVYTGLIKESTMEHIAPDGPYKNTSYKITLFEDQILVAPGGRSTSDFFAPLFNTDGYYHYMDNAWRHISYQETTVPNITELAVNPLNPEEIYGSVYSGEGNSVTLDNQFEYLITTDNSSFNGLTSPSGEIRSVSNIFDEEGNYYGVESYSINNNGNSLNIRNTAGQWVNISLQLPIAGTSHILLDDKDWLWIGSPRTHGKLVAYDTNGTPLNTGDDVQYVFSSGEGEGNLPQDERVICVAQDKSGVIWIGTSEGVRIKRNAHSELEAGNLDTSLIIVEYNGLPEELLKDVTVLDIVADEANNKWIATSGGVFYVSQDGTETKKFFDYNNSPLPSNFVTDIEIDNKTGKIYFATLDGIVSYQGDYKEAGDEFGDIVVYPNPVRPGFQGNIVIKGLAQNAKVKITDVNGNLVFQGTAKGGAIEWDQRNLQGKNVASGVYLALMLNDSNLITATTKFAIVR